MIIQNRLPMLQISENIWFSSCPTLRPVDLLTPRHVRLLSQRPRYFLVNWLNSWKVHHLTFVQRCTGSLYSCVDFTGYMGPVHTCIGPCYRPERGGTTDCVLCWPVVNVFWQLQDEAVITVHAAFLDNYERWRKYLGQESMAKSRYVCLSFSLT